jgi:putative addiction module component (TIGR02574 family)
MATAATVLAEALKLSVEDRVRLAEELLASAQDEGAELGDDDPSQTLDRRARELRDGTVRGLSVDEARRTMLSDDEP